MPNDPLNDPSNPPNVTYTSTCGGDLSSWDGSFTYDNGTIVYTRTNPSGTYNTTNQSQGNAIVFSLPDTSVTPTGKVKFNGSTFVYKNNKAEYTGNCHQEPEPPTDNQDGWTATQE